MSIVVLTGGVGGAKFALGLIHAAPAAEVTAIVNTGDDFSHCGLAISPDIDTLLYTLAGLANLEHGWGRVGESWNFMAALGSLGGPDWFRLGDGDLALHVVRTMRRARGDSLSDITADVARAWGIAAAILPMSDDPVMTLLDTDEGELEFQDYFVRRQCRPAARAIRFAGAGAARPNLRAIEAILSPDTSAVLIAPSNPLLSVDPILAVPGFREALVQTSAPVVAISPVVAGEAVKGPTAKLMRELGRTVDAAGIARHYEGLIDGLVIDERDPPATLAIRHDRFDTMMTSLERRIDVARAALAFAQTLRE